MYCTFLEKIKEKNKIMSDLIELVYNIFIPHPVTKQKLYNLLILHFNTILSKQLPTTFFF